MTMTAGMIDYKDPSFVQLDLDFANCYILNNRY